MKYPDKYFIYKYSINANLARKIGRKDLFKKGEAIIEGNEFFDEINTKLKQDSEIQNELKSVLTDDCWQDSESADN